ncbi:MAG TPA: hypothetical protein VMV72_05935 [Verrucomicrobiae bacterium]|nr:hypothetical protein [Verrucomicrobiae bacterium]
MKHSTLRTLGFLAMVLWNGGCVSGPRPIVWEQLPFPKDSDWPGSKGAPAAVAQDELILQAQEVRTTEEHSVPLVIQCAAYPDLTNAPHSWLLIKFVPVGQPLDTEPDRLTTLAIGNRHAPPSGDKDVMFIERREGGRARKLWGEQEFTAKPDRVYHLKAEISPDKIRITIDGQTFEAPGVTVGYPKFYVQLQGWQPPNRWHVQDFSIH